MKNKDSKARMQVIFGVLLFAFVMSTELYAMINYSKMYLVIAGLAVIDLVCLYVVINGLFALREMKDARNEEQYDSVFKSEKASYLMLKKYFEEIEDKLNYLEKAAKVPTEEIVNAQKGIAKVIINRNRENTEALINSNEQVMEQFTECSSTIADITKLLSAYKDEIVSEQKKTEEVNEHSGEDAGSADPDEGYGAAPESGNQPDTERELSAADGCTDVYTAATGKCCAAGREAGGKCAACD